MLMTFERIAFSIERRSENLIYSLYCLYRYIKVRRIRKQQQIRVVFLLSELSVWKTEILCSLMLKHPKFDVRIAVFHTNEDSNATEQLLGYLKEKAYDFVLLDNYSTINHQLEADIIFYQKPYDGLYPRSLHFRYNVNSLFCYVNYAFNTVLEPGLVNLPLKKYAWKVFYENSIVLNEERKFFKKKCNNAIITGLPVSDEYLLQEKKSQNPWKELGNKKRIVWAAHHTIGDLHVPGIAYSTFLLYMDFMLEIAMKYSGKIQMAFKPHPSLKEKLIKVLGRAETEAYYDKWNSLENCQLETGKYVDLFCNADAIIHDCGSFTVEAHYARCPIMYLVREENHDSNLNQFAKDAFNLHYKGYNKKNIEDFINNVINGIDPMKEKRDAFFNECLLPPNGKLASENIISNILGD